MTLLNISPSNLIRKHHPQHTQEAISQSVQLFHNRLNRLPRAPPQPISLLPSPLPLTSNRICVIIVQLLLVITVVIIIVQIRQIGLIQAEVAGFEGLAARSGGSNGTVRKGGIGGHFLPGLVLMPFLALFLPFDKRVNFCYGSVFVNMANVDGALEEGVHVQFPTLGPVTEELEDALNPSHESGEEAIVMDVDFVDEFVEVVLVAGAEVDKSLNGLVRVGGDILTLEGGEDGESVVCKGGEVGDGVVDVGGFVYADEGFVEDCEEVTEEVQGYGFFNNGLHLDFVALAGIEFKELFEMSKELGTGFHFVVDLYAVSWILYVCERRTLRFRRRCSKLHRR